MSALAVQPFADGYLGADSPAILISKLWKRYGAVEAVRGIDLEIREREIFGLIGPDGAGKTSTFQILAGVMEASSGTVRVFGKPARDARSETGYLTQAFSLYPDLSVMENIRYIGDLRQVPREDVRKRANRYLRMFDMDRFGDRLAGRLSGGMKQKLALACALVPQPRVLLLDEPTTGVDPVSRREFWDTLAHLAIDGLTILVATPYLDEAERCNRVALIHEGEIRQIGTPSELRGSLGAKRLELRTVDLGKAERLLEAQAGEGKTVADVQRFGDRLDVLAREPDKAEAEIAETLGRENLKVDEIRIGEPTLENTFVARLRSLGRTISAVPFPGEHSHQDLQRKIGDERRPTDQAVWLIHGGQKRLAPGRIWRDLWPARRERSRQDDHDQDALRVAETHLGQYATGWRKGRVAFFDHPSAHRIHVTKVLLVRRPVHS